MSWSLKELAALIEKKYGYNQKQVANPILNSIQRKCEIAKFHIIEFRKLQDKYFNDDETENYENAIGYIFDRINQDENALSYFEDCFYSEAHVVAYSQSIHSVFDIIGQAIIQSLNIASEFNPKQNVYLYTVKNKLSQINKWQGIVDSISKLYNSDFYSYLNAFVNTTNIYVFSKCLTLC